MAASYPSSVKSFTTRVSGANILSGHMNDVQNEIAAIESDLVAGLPVVRGGTGATNASSARTNLAVLGTAGGTMTGLLTTNGQVAFPATQNPSSDVNTLDDYEEGTWTPVMGGSGGTSGQSYSTQVGYYVKIGKQVTVTWTTTISTVGTITGNLQIQGLPFTSQNVNAGDRFICAINWYAANASYVAMQGRLKNGVSVIEVDALTAAGASLSGSTRLQASVGVGESLSGTLTYFV